MAQILHFDVALVTTILGFWMAGIVHIVSIGIASHGLRASRVQTKALSQAYYYAIFAAALYQVISYLLCATAWGAYKNHYRKQFRLTIGQRTLMVQTMAFLVYDWLGALIYANIEGWKFLDAIYWSNLTILTIGLGDLYVPTTTLGRALLFPYALGGVIFVGLVVGSIRSLVLAKGRAKIRARLTEKMRLKARNRIAGAGYGLSTNHRPSGKLLGTTKRKSVSLTDQAKLFGRMAQFNAMRTVQKSAQRKRKAIALSVSLAAATIFWTIGAVIFWITERTQRWSYFESLYFSYTTLMTIGYGDFRPKSNSGKPFFVLWSLLAVPSLTILTSNLGETAVKWLKDLTIWVGEATLHSGKRGSTRTHLQHNICKLIGRMIGNHKRLGDPEKGTLGDQMQKLQQIKRIYSDLAISVEDKKRYSFAEWAFFLELLGEEEAKSDLNLQALRKSDNDGRKERGPGLGGTQTPVGRSDNSLSSHTGPESQRRKEEDTTEKWSWLDERSPLCVPQPESQWLLENLFRRLEQCLEDHWNNEMSCIVTRREGPIAATAT
ncbi:hypothetical protein LTS15_011272 [Exophiala xenobiotica]|nr:hypothetical protein LTS15_011272 [Exophiala xenobiotica]